jgi:hypothetical protein
MRDCDFAGESIAIPRGGARACDAYTCACSERVAISLRRRAPPPYISYSCIDILFILVLTIHTPTSTVT